MRELAEETGLAPEAVVLDPGFRREVHYEVEDPEGGRVPKRVVYFLGRLRAPAAAAVRLSAEHDAFAWCTPAEIEQRVAFANLRAVLREAAARAGTAP
ncbi:MAG: hypothetical protein KatS3mg102_2178 [Planctomycetota bacterium]|nr:MAG: hypothetical protein KatS3mg102_2178 [Planctomycetota bacterium]